MDIADFTHPSKVGEGIKRAVREALAIHPDRESAAEIRPSRAKSHEASDETRWPIGRTVLFVIASSSVLWTGLIGLARLVL